MTSLLAQNAVFKNVYLIDSYSNIFLFQEKAHECFNLHTPKSNFLQAITKTTIEKQKARGEPGYRSCDTTAMAVALDSSIILESVKMFTVVELNGSNTRGMLVADWRNMLCKLPNVTIVEKTDTKKSLTLWRGMVLE